MSSGVTFRLVDDTESTGDTDLSEWSGDEPDLQATAQALAIVHTLSYEVLSEVARFARRRLFTRQYRKRRRLARVRRKQVVAALGDVCPRCMGGSDLDTIYEHYKPHNYTGETWDGPCRYCPSTDIVHVGDGTPYMQDPVDWDEGIARVCHCCSYFHVPDLEKEKLP